MARFGLGVLSLPAYTCLIVCPCVCIDPKFVSAITCDLFKSGPPNLNQGCKTPWLRFVFLCVCMWVCVYVMLTHNPNFMNVWFFSTRVNTVRAGVKYVFVFVFVFKYANICICICI